MASKGFKTEEQRKAEAKAKKEAKEREQEELRMLFSQIQGGAGKRSKVEEAKRLVSGSSGMMQGWVSQPYACSHC